MITSVYIFWIAKLGNVFAATPQAGTRIIQTFYRHHFVHSTIHETP